MTEAVRVHRGDPILSFDGKTIVARWAVDMELAPGANSFSWHWHVGVGAPVMRDLPDGGSEPENKAVVRLRWASGPFRIWQVLTLRGTDQDQAFRSHWFLPPDVEPGRSDAGIVAACDALLGLPMLPDAHFLDRLRHLRSIYADRAERQKRKEIA